MAKGLIGTVVSVKMKNTVVVMVENRRSHPLYKKMLKTNKRFKVHNQDLDLVMGDKVKIEETRPISKDVSWKVAKKV